MADTTQPETPESGESAAQPSAPEASSKPSELSKPSKPSKDEKRAERLARQITAFAGSHGGAEGQLAHIGRGTVRIALVGADGEWGVLVAPSQDSARRAAEIAGLTLQDDFGGELAAKVRTGPYEWTRMAGIQLGGPGNPPAAAS
ncbi:hypothetical protein [Streptomyces rapamycinicus]|uniref:Uncharacterized protein n=2 Tax=Streptomyces rapamycinicus TaxID=1226757 RepID=A0A0A0NGQ0_STRRN|nr:hypothetical protein [Streptomyces rapamycinicus]AGP58737.1 hypothetical protein M271_36680 [Streptomyces rapamycinicus NRRL 5491]MBB4786456.1 hypothetical protein [Streptomyces rapamycinicus]RLV78085.1 hypothetical protein D3C57_106910 [Streptomyces rapamycinicus NRRL 5491]UTO66546.1 hypothetical protein LJB45_32220 [Streptomyces rapamycinicus]UTP34500.1 hypothetical protein LIV37_37350 [Streptomyces rapamycinicus NRRL 5491]